MPIAAVLLDLDFPMAVLKGIPILARTASLLAHLAEEADRPIGFILAHNAEAAIAYEPDEPS
jgi:citrate synthase